MPYSITGLVIKLSERDVAQTHGLPLVELQSELGLIPLEREYLLLEEGGDTSHRSDFDFEIPEWLKLLTQDLSCAAYIEAEIYGGEGMQASISFTENRPNGEALISSRAINFALRQLGIDDEHTKLSTFGLPMSSGRDPFDMVGLGRRRSVEGWLEVWEEEGG